MSRLPLRIAVAVVCVLGASSACRGAGFDAPRPAASVTPPASSTTIIAPAQWSPSPTPRPTAAPRRSAVPPPRHRSKKGVSTWAFPGVGAALTDVHASWYYNWSAGPTAGAGSSAEFVPMIWGPGSVTPSTLDLAKAAGATVLGFNEPDFTSQANMSVEQALNLWPGLQATGLRLGSPAVATDGATPGGWLDRFMSGARARGLRVDFITLHWYGGDFGAAAVGQLESYVRAVHDRYQLPIWVTEFALIRFGAGGATYPTAPEQVAFIQGATAMLNGLSYVERYAWFALPTSNDGDATGLYRDGANPTPAGVAYRPVP